MRQRLDRLDPFFAAAAIAIAGLTAMSQMPYPLIVINLDLPEWRELSQ
ncbi:MAG: hypothetical protein ACFB12_17570 [Leptolyngbyaceae cyanobacterium]